MLYEMKCKKYHKISLYIEPGDVREKLLSREVHESKHPRSIEFRKFKDNFSMTFTPFLFQSRFFNDLLFIAQ